MRSNVEFARSLRFLVPTLADPLRRAPDRQLHCHWYFFGAWDIAGSL